MRQGEVIEDPKEGRRRPGRLRTLRVWQRDHGDDLIAEVMPVEGMGRWRALACVRDSPDFESDPRSFSLLIEAHSAADRLVRERFAHTCTAACGEWQPIERPRTARDHGVDSAGDDDVQPQRSG